MKQLNTTITALIAVLAVLLSAIPSRAGQGTPAEKKLPKLVDLGANKCIPCKKMAPILEQLKRDYVGQMNVEFIDVWKDEKAAKEYKIKLIPTQIFYGADGKELFRHEGFFGRDDILKKWKELGVNLTTKPTTTPAT